MNAHPALVVDDGQLSLLAGLEDQVGLLQGDRLRGRCDLRRHHLVGSQGFHVTIQQEDGGVSADGVEDVDSFTHHLPQKPRRVKSSGSIPTVSRRPHDKGTNYHSNFWIDTRGENIQAAKVCLTPSLALLSLAQ